MKQNTTLVIAALFSVFLFSVHLTGDIILGIEKGNWSNLGAFPIFAVWMFGALVLADRRSGRIIMFLGSLLSLAVPILHMRGKGLGVAGRIATSDGAFIFIWTVIALGAVSLFSLMLMAYEMWSIRRGEAR